MESNLQYKKRGKQQKEHLEKKIKNCAHKVYSEIKKKQKETHSAHVQPGPQYFKFLGLATTTIIKPTAVQQHIQFEALGKHLNSKWANCKEYSQITSKRNSSPFRPTVPFLADPAPSPHTFCMLCIAVGTPSEMCKCTEHFQSD